MLFVCQQVWREKFEEIWNYVLINELNVEHCFSLLVGIKETMSQKIYLKLTIYC